MLNYSQEDWAQLVFNADKRAIDDADNLLNMNQMYMVNCMLLTVHLVQQL